MDYLAVGVIQQHDRQSETWGWAGGAAWLQKTRTFSGTLPQPVIILFFDVGVFLMGFGSRSHSAPQQQQQQQLQVGRKRARPGEEGQTHGRPAADSEITLEHLGMYSWFLSLFNQIYLLLVHGGLE